MSRRDYQPGQGPVRGLVVALLLTLGFYAIFGVAFWAWSAVTS